MCTWAFKYRYAAEERQARSAVDISRDFFLLVSKSFHAPEATLITPAGRLGVMCVDRLLEIYEVLPPEKDLKIQEKNRNMVLEIYQKYERGIVRYLEALDTSRMSTEANLMVRDIFIMSPSLHYPMSVYSELSFWCDHILWTV